MKKKSLIKHRATAKKAIVATKKMKKSVTVGRGGLQAAALQGSGGALKGPATLAGSSGALKGPATLEGGFKGGAGMLEGGFRGATGMKD